MEKIDISKLEINNKKKNKKIPIPKIIKLSGVSFCKNNIDKLSKGDELDMKLEPDNKYDDNAIKVLNKEGQMVGYIPKKYKVNADEFILNVLVKKKFEKLTNKYILKVHEVYKWDGPTGLEVTFIQKKID